MLKTSTVNLRRREGGKETGSGFQRVITGKGKKMLHLPNEGHTIYEVSIYNREVRALVKENQSHYFFDDQWADVQVHDVTAIDEVEARKLIAERFPPDDGFVIENVHITHF